MQKRSRGSRTHATMPKASGRPQCTVGPPGKTLHAATLSTTEYSGRLDCRATRRTRWSCAASPFAASTAPCRYGVRIASYNCHLSPKITDQVLHTTTPCSFAAPRCWMCERASRT
eukprot:5446188-Prymnesium_polylepis.1